MKYFPHTAEDIQQMLDVVGVKSLDELYAEVPEELKLHRELHLPEGKSEIEVRQIIGELAEQNKRLVPFAGAGAYDHYTPSVIPYLAARSEFSTSYTPYQAEISQGTLQYIFEYQTMMADLTGMDLSNASMYDGATATAEAMMMCVAAAKKRNRVLVSATFNPAVLAVVRTYAHFHGVDLVEVPAKDGQTDRAALSALHGQGQGRHGLFHLLRDVLPAAPGAGPLGRHLGQGGAVVPQAAPGKGFRFRPDGKNLVSAYHQAATTAPMEARRLLGTNRSYR